MSIVRELFGGICAGLGGRVGIAKSWIGVVVALLAIPGESLALLTIGW